MTLKKVLILQIWIEIMSVLKLCQLLDYYRWIEYMDRKIEQMDRKIVREKDSQREKDRLEDKQLDRQIERYLVRYL